MMAVWRFLMKMQKTQIKILLLAGLWLLPMASFAQKKQIEEAQAIIKSGKKVEKAEQLMTDLLKKDSANRQNPKIYATWFSAVETLYEQANEKLYVKEKYDTVAFFNLTRRLYDIALSLDSLDARPNKKGRQKFSYRKSNGETLNQLRPNLYFGGTFYVRKNDFKEAFDFFAHYLDAAQQPLFESYKYATTDSVMPRAAYWATYCGYRMNDAEKILRYADIGLAYKPRAQYVLQYQCEAYSMQNDEQAYYETLKKGFDSYPEYQYFFPRLADYYANHGQNDSLMAVADQGLRVNAKNTLFLLAKSLALLNAERYDECIDVSKQMIEINDTLPEPYFNIATCYLNQALTLEERGEARKYRTKLQQFYRDARPFMEDYRRLVPDDKKRWAPALYRIYLNLNLGKQFEEIDRLMK